MGRENSPHVVGPFWLDHRPDGKSPFWQIAWYDPERNTSRYASTRCRALSDAINVIDAHYEKHKANQPQIDALVIPHLVRYWHEHGSKAIKPQQIASSLRMFIAFLFQDEAGPGLTFKTADKAVFRRFVEWRMKPHAYELEWEGKLYRYQSKRKVNGESVQRNLDDVRAALNFAANDGKVPSAPKVENVKAELRSPPRTRRLSVKELGAMVGYAASDPPLLRFILAMLGTLTRPEAVMKWRTDEQVDWEHGIINTHPKGAPLTKKRNAIMPIADGLYEWLKVGPNLWISEGHNQQPIKSLRTRWRTMRRVLGLSDDVIAKTVRRTVASRLRSRKVSIDDIRLALGHDVVPVDRAYIVFDPDYLADVKREIDALWIEVLFSARSWLTDHSRTKPVRGKPIMVVPKEPKC